MSLLSPDLQSLRLVGLAVACVVGLLWLFRLAIRRPEVVGLAFCLLSMLVLTVQLIVGAVELFP
ncbi:MAG TPA: hypothetical protein DDZ67_09110 [Xanthomonadaceae bacterium]|nr:hypothetical protein [Xanthomonadaceae bacterium]